MNWRNMKRLTIMLPIVSCMVAFGQEAAGWKAGVARAKITPEKPVWLAGYGGRDHVMEGVRQDVWAKALALEDRKGRVGVIVTLDLCNTTKELGDAMLDLIEKRHGLKREQVILNSSHTHSGPLIGFIKRHVYPLSDAAQP